VTADAGRAPVAQNLELDCAFLACERVGELHVVERVEHIALRELDRAASAGCAPRFDHVCRCSGRAIADAIVRIHRPFGDAGCLVERVGRCRESGAVDVTGERQGAHVGANRKLPEHLRRDLSGCHAGLLIERAPQ